MPRMNRINIAKTLLIALALVIAAGCASTEPDRDPDPEEFAAEVDRRLESDPNKRANLIDRLNRLVHLELGIDVYVELVPLHTLPRTSSGKLSRSKARQNFMDSHDLAALAAERRAVS